ncbi:MAG: lysylphosphatidylglycerol synthase transmembrane domain-containing protein [Pseudomonadota bacterium]
MDKQSENTPKRGIIKKGISILAVAAVAGYTVWRWDQLLPALKQTDGYWVLLGICLYYMNYYFRARRFVALAHNGIRLFPEAVHAASIHGIASYLMPVRSGDLALPFILKSSCNLSLSQGSSLLIKARLLDISILGLFTLWAALLSFKRFSFMFSIVWLLTGLGMLLSFLIISFSGRKLASLVSRYSDKISRLFSIETATPEEILLSILIWLFIGLGYYCVARAIRLNISYSDIWLLITIQLPLQLLPIQGIANAGNHEAGWVAGLVLLGFTPDKALDYALISHAVFILYVFVLGIPLVLTKQKFWVKPFNSFTKKRLGD